MTPRALTAADLDAIDTLQPPDWPVYRATFERYFQLSCCTPFGIEEAGSRPWVPSSSSARLPGSPS